MSAKTRNLTGREAAERLGLTPEAVNMFSRRGCPCDAKGPPHHTKYNESEVREWLKTFNPDNRKTAAPTDPSMDELKRKTEQERHRKLKLANDEADGKLIRTADAFSAWSECVQRIRYELSAKVFSPALVEELEADGGVALVDMQKAKKTQSNVEYRVHEALYNPNYSKAKREHLRTQVDDSYYD